MPVPHSSIPSGLYDCSRLFPDDLSRHYSGKRVQDSTRWWMTISAITTSFVGGGSRVFITSKFVSQLIFPEFFSYMILCDLVPELNSLRVVNRDRLLSALHHRDRGRPLITVANHHSCMDEPLLWGE